jgi:hypothetical protein
MPTWPVEAERRRRTHDAERVPNERIREAAFGLSLVANVVLLASVLGVLAFIQMGLFAQGRASAQPTTNFTVSSPSDTMTASPSPSPDAATLQVTPSSVQLTCAGDQSTQVVTLQNSGAMTVQWRATFSLQKPGVTVSPQQGELAAADTVAIQVQQSTGPHGGSSGQGVISFTPTTPDGGQPAQLAYTIAGCHEQ